MSGYYIQEHKYPNIMDVWNDTTKSSNTHATAQETPTSTGPNMLLTGILMGLVIIFSITLCYMTLPTLIRWVRKKVPVSEARVQRRYETVEGWLISKRVRPHCETCEQIQAKLGTATKKLPNIKLAASYDTAETVLEEDGRECPVCMEPFAVDEIVSWSPCKTCDHVFHHECIKEWLLYHENCPYCRVTFLPIDSDTSTVAASTAARAQNTALFSTKSKAAWTVQQLSVLAQQRTNRLLTTYYCLEEGLVTLQRPLAKADARIENSVKSSSDGKKASVATTVNAMKRLLSTGVQQDELSKMRGSKNRETETALDIIVTVGVQTVTDTGAATPTGRQSSEALNFADAVVDIEMCMGRQLRVISNSHDDVSNALEEVEALSSPRSR